mmetsp:Transcript_16519/g.27695  ORF Transcript_16519/g.27695 Transcript_16519/m.27695 type:complete len:122 (-) Transcript_16519:2809-3174(-)
MFTQHRLLRVKYTYNTHASTFACMPPCCQCLPALSYEINIRVYIHLNFENFHNLFYTYIPCVKISNILLIHRYHVEVAFIRALSAWLDSSVDSSRDPTAIPAAAAPPAPRGSGDGGVFPYL